MNDETFSETDDLTLADLTPAEILTAWKEGFPDEVTQLSSATEGYDFQYLPNPTQREVMKFSTHNLPEPVDFEAFIEHFNNTHQDEPTDPQG